MVLAVDNMRRVGRSVIGGAVARNAWWTIPPLAVAVALGLTFGLWALWFGYVAFNSIGLWLYCDQLGPARPTKQRWLKALALLRLPVGVIGLFATTASPTPSESISSASIDPSIRQGTAAASAPIDGGSAGG